MQIHKGAHAALADTFSLPESEPRTPTVVYVNSIAGNVYLEKERDVHTFIQTFDLMRAAAPVPPPEPSVTAGAALTWRPFMKALCHGRRDAGPGRSSVVRSSYDGARDPAPRRLRARDHHCV
ncbi:Scr1 family TA system antitoxin-like transcriptional regulator [Streptomyces pseudovenezuelae]|uniref:DUF5753 domain-containing protein n=1 Tax=Streptomyces pseudovenezuelae TaxID=67350 RepID=A0ABT6M2A5_9ACTN|nr:Scr1 family TA system antitoxin-like transcriptional regulator [Streptomyces pseudovenezuelae]MDH6222681.1 hypothetical protein [Streptomyces pseudovenezuelae]